MLMATSCSWIQIYLYICFMMFMLPKSSSLGPYDLSVKGNVGVGIRPPPAPKEGSAGSCCEGKLNFLKGKIYGYGNILGKISKKPQKSSQSNRPADQNNSKAPLTYPINDGNNEGKNNNKGYGQNLEAVRAFKHTPGKSNAIILSNGQNTFKVHYGQGEVELPVTRAHPAIYHNHQSSPNREKQFSSAEDQRKYKQIMSAIIKSHHDSKSKPVQPAQWSKPIHHHSRPYEGGPGSFTNAKLPSSSEARKFQDNILNNMHSYEFGHSPEADHYDSHDFSHHPQNSYEHEPKQMPQFQLNKKPLYHYDLHRHNNHHHPEPENHHFESHEKHQQNNYDMHQHHTPQYNFESHHSPEEHSHSFEHISPNSGSPFSEIERHHQFPYSEQNNYASPRNSFSPGWPNIHEYAAMVTKYNKTPDNRRMSNIKLPETQKRFPKPQKRMLIKTQTPKPNSVNKKVKVNQPTEVTKLVQKSPLNKVIVGNSKKGFKYRIFEFGQDELLVMEGKIVEALEAENLHDDMVEAKVYSTKDGSLLRSVIFNNVPETETKTS